MNLFLWVSSIILFLYFILILGFFFRWRKEMTYQPSDPQIFPFISIVIPFFNESDRLESLILNLNRQSYPRDRYELILVNDHSTDDYTSVIRNVTGTHIPVKVIDSASPPGKKYALREGILASESEYILISDADCYFPPDWIRLHGAFFSQNQQVSLVSSGVRIQDPVNFAESYHALEFASLIVTGAASFFQDDPIMCNGANLAFRKDLFLEAFEHMHPEVNTGDDMFLMLYAKKKKRKMAFLKHSGSFTSTSAPHNWKALFSQRLRWASKANFYRDPKLIYTSLMVLLINTLILSQFFLGLFFPSFLLVFLGFLLIKSIPDYFILKNYTDFSKQKGIMKFFLPSQLINLLFIPLSGITGVLIPPRRGRKL